MATFSKDSDEALIHAVTALAEAISKQSSPSIVFPEQSDAQAFVFSPETNNLRAVKNIAAPRLDLLLGIDRTKNTLLENSQRFAKGFSANNALLWGARGMGKSTLIKAIHNHLVQEFGKEAPSLVEIHREDISELPELMNVLRASNRTFILFCDDLSFNRPDRDFKALKSVLEGGLEGRPDNVIFYASSNRRHLLPRQMADQESAIGIHPNESMDETIALSDRFGLWLGFHAADQTDYLAIIEGYIAEFQLNPRHDWKHDALEWAKTRGNRSGRTAWQYVNNLAGELEQKIKF
ncbi:ATP-binding protein [Kordiimonas sp. SCSIO 12603]|uniref:ATP-binding protein n=1 Tax=Kordiimonas sp. SCSIO 12603 TaxID=2829596 RepID=UPI0021038962|nr:ATP-binding protein [Kordiimonas sp. SCSIO 12603]UTW57679.1 ATP-binding protein [Kordiimonas sp. SCSIO 12603]